MRPALAFTAVVLGRLLRDRVSLFFMVALPVIVIVIVGGTFGGPGTIDVGLVAGRPGPVGTRLVRALERAPGISLHRYADVETLRRAARRESVRAGVVIGAGVEAAARAGRPVRVGLVLGPSADAALTARTTVQGILGAEGVALGAASFAARESGTPLARALAVADRLAGGAVPGVRVEDVGSGAGAGRFSLTAPQNLVLFVFITCLASGALIVQTRRTGVLRRSLASPVSVGAIVTGLGAAWLALGIVQSAIILAIGSLAFGVWWGDPLAAALLVVVFALVGCGAGLLVGAAGRDEDRVGSITPIAGIVLGAIGGCMVPLEVFPAAMRAVAHATPHYWAVESWQRLIFDRAGVVDVLPALGVLLAFGVALTGAAAVILRRDLTG